MRKLVDWKNEPARKPLLLQGARQVGKTWLAEELGRTAFRRTAHVVFLDNDAMLRAFEGSLSPDRLLPIISAETGVPVGDPETLIILDEVQECPRALTALKLFCELRPEVPIVAAGSLLGVALHRGVSFPVGKVDHLYLNPMTFYEFLLATGNDALAEAAAEPDTDMLTVFSEKLTDLLRQYFYVGGMPEAVEAFARSRDFGAARSVQLRLLTDYELDFSKHASPLLSERIREVWHSVPSQLARENSKFIYSAVRPGGRARKYEEAIGWLADAGLVTRVDRVSKPGLPLSAYKDLSAFKLYLLDVGLLAASSRLDLKTLFDGSALFQEFKGSLTEQYVCQQLAACNGVTPYYWADGRSSAEVDFIYDRSGAVIPVEVKAGENLRAKSLKAFAAKYRIPRSLRFSLSGPRDEGWLLNMPLYAANAIPRIP